MKLIPDQYTFDASAKTITCQDFTSLERIAIIQNLITGDTIYDFGDSTKGGTLVNKVLTLDFDTTSMGDLDKLQIILHPNVFTENGAVGVGNAMKKFRSGFFDGLDQDTWTEVWTGTRQSTANVTGNAAGAKYLQIALSPEDSDVSYTLTSTESYKLPHRFGYGLSISQRITGQEVFAGLVGVDDAGVVEKNTTPTPLSISGTVSITTNVATINFATRHNLVALDRVILYGNAEKRLDVGPVAVTVVTPYQITVPCVLANGTYTAGGFVALADPLDDAKNGYGYLAENLVATNLSAVSRRNGGRFISTNSTSASTLATQVSTSPFTKAYRSTSDNELFASLEEVFLISRTGNSVGGASGGLKYTESLPTEQKEYKLQFRAKILANATKVVAKISNIAKTGTTTATVTTSAPHGLITGDFVQIYGVRDIVNFPNLTASTVVASVPTSTTFTIVIGTASTVSSSGGVVVLNQGSVLYPGGLNFSIQSIVASDNILTVTLNTTAAGLLNGQTVYIGGMTGSASSYDGLYTVGRMNLTTVELVPLVDGGTIPSITSTNTGGSIAIATDVRIHYARQLEFTRHIVELVNSRGLNDAARALPVTGTVGVSGTVTALVAAATLNIPATIADVAAAAITTTTTTAAFTPTSGMGYQLSIPVTAVSGTNPLMVITIEESLDSGTNWFPRCTFRCALTETATSTAVGIYYSPYLKIKGNRVRYTQTITGTTPSITRAINRFQGQSDIGEGVPYKIISAATTNATLVKTGPTTISMLTGSNVNAAARYLKIYDKATAPTVGTDPVAYTFILPGAATGGGSNVPLARELNLIRGFGLALTTGATDADTGAVAANEIIINAQIS